MLEKQQLIIRILKILYKIGLITVFGLLVQIYTSQLGLFDDIHIEISGNQFINQDRIIKEVKPFLNQSLLSINLDKIQDGDIEDWNKMIDSNVKGLLYVTKAVIGRMIEKSSGHIINIGSLAGREVYEKGNVYSASKHAVNAISKGMRIDLNKHNIKVSEINPGLVETEFSKVRFKGDPKASKVYEGYKALEAEDIAEIIEFVISRPHHVNIADLLVLPQDQATSSIINKK